MNPNPISPKVTASVAAAAVVTLLVWAATIWHVEVPVLVQGALITLISGAAGYLRRDPLRRA